jgi:class 3 adenylate cyclase
VLPGPGRLHRLTGERGDQAAAALVESLAVLVRPPDGARFVELGAIQLKGFARPVRPLEVCRA